MEIVLTYQLRDKHPACLHYTIHTKTGSQPVRLHTSYSIVSEPETRRSSEDSNPWLSPLPAFETDAGTRPAYCSKMTNYTAVAYCPLPLFADGVGFEPTVPVSGGPPLSKRMQSASLPPIQSSMPLSTISCTIRRETDLISSFDP